MCLSSLLTFHMVWYFLSYLSEEETKTVKLGSGQILQGRDRAGRRILVHNASNSWDEYTAHSRLRIAYYLMMSLADDIETQRKGYALFIFASASLYVHVFLSHFHLMLL